MSNIKIGYNSEEILYLLKQATQETINVLCIFNNQEAIRTLASKIEALIPTKCIKELNWLDTGQSWILINKSRIDFYVWQ